MEHMSFLVKKATLSRFHQITYLTIDSFDALRGVRPISCVSVGKLRNHLPRVAGQLQLHGPITKDLIVFGYETDDLWHRELSGVDPDIAESHWPDYYTKLHLCNGNSPIKSK